MFEFENKNAVVFGAGRNIGRCIALEFARRGCNIAAVDINAGQAQETAFAVSELGVQSSAVSCDVADEQAVTNTVRAIEEQFGRIDILVNNVGIVHSGNPEDFPVSEWELIFSVNFFGAVRANAAVLPGMLSSGGGYIVNVASFAGLYPYATNRIPYAASKAALISMSENMAINLLPRGIHVSCLCPGPTVTTAINGLKPWTENVVMRGPGSHLSVATQENVAKILADGMIEEKIVILTHQAGWDMVRDHGVSPDQFIRQTIDEYERGESGLPG